MTAPWQLLELWPVRVLLVGGLILLVGRIALMLVRQPARRTVIGTATVLAALAVIPLTRLPGWLPVKVEQPASPVAQAAPAPVGPPSPKEARPPVAPEEATPREVPPQFAFVFTEEAPAAAVSPPAPARESQAAGSLPASNPQPEAASPAIDWPAWAVVAYAVIAMLFLLRLVVGHIGLARLWRAAHPVPSSTERLFGELAAETCPRAQLRISERVGGPVCFGVLRPRVLVPVAILAGDERSQRAIFAHELGHLRRRDPLAGWLLGLARAAYFVWPWLAGIRREVRLAQEFLSDSEAARRSGNPADYAELLIRMTRARPAPLGAAGVRGSSSDLFRRVTMLLRNTKPVESRCPRRWALAVGGGLTALAVALGGLYVQPRMTAAAEPEKKEPKDAKTESLKQAIEKLKKDVGDDPEARKQLDKLLKELESKKAPREGAAPLPIPILPAVPPAVIAPLDPDDELQQLEQELRQQAEALLRQIQGGGLRGGIAIAPHPISPFSGMGGGRLGIRVEKPSDTLATQLDLPNGQGLVCVDVPADSNAGKIGLKPHDILLEVAGKPVPSEVPEFVKNLRDVKSDQAVDVIVLRKGKKETLKGVKLPEAREAAALPPLVFPTPIQAPFAPQAVPVDPLVGPRATVAVGPGETVRVEQVNDAFTVFYSKNGVKLTVAGSKDGGTVKADSIEVEDNGKTTKAESVEKLPKEYQDLARNALKAIK